MTIRGVTVFMALYNGEKFLRESIDSIINQTYTDFTFLIINDGSTDASVKIVESYTDPRITLVHNDGNRGLIYTLNKAFELVKTPYMVRQDADDVSKPERIEKLVRFMECNPEVVICSSWIHYFGYYSRTIEQAHEAEDIKIKALSRCPLTHGAGIFRVEEFLKSGLRYDDRYKHAEDFEMLTQACQQVKMHNLQEVLYLYRTHEDQVCFKHKDYQLQQDDVIRIKYAKEALGIVMSPSEAETHMKLVQPLISKTANDELYLLFEWRDRLIRENLRTQFFDHTRFRRFLQHNLELLVYIRKQYSPRLLYDLFRFRIQYAFWLPPGRLFRFVLKCLSFSRA